MAYDRENYLRNRERALARYRENREARIAYQVAWNANNLIKKRTYNSTWDKKHPDKRNAITRNRRARKKSADGSHTASDIQDLKRLQKGRCAYSWCRADLSRGCHVDHIEALASGGSNDRSNIQLLCPTCNRKKHVKDSLVFARENGLLL